MSEKILIPNGVSPRQAAALTSSIPPRFTKALDLVTSKHADELMRDHKLLDLWLFRVTGLRLRPNGKRCDESRVRIHYTEAVIRSSSEWLGDVCHPMMKSGVLVLDDSTGCFGAYHDVKIIAHGDRIDHPTSFFCTVIIRDVRDERTEPFLFEEQRELGCFIVNRYSSFSIAALQAFLGAVYNLKNK